jgi:hypothetical protein
MPATVLRFAYLPSSRAQMDTQDQGCVNLRSTERTQEYSVYKTV